MTIFNEILDTRSMTCIHYMVEQAMPTAEGEQLEVLNRIYTTTKLDEIYALCHDYLGQPEEAAKLRAFMARSSKL